MPEITSINIKRGNHVYGVSVGWDDAKLSDGIIEFEITAFRASSEDPNKKQAIRAGVSVEDGGSKGPLLKITIEGKEVFSHPLKELFHEESIVGRAIESAHASFYGVDPVLGCLIRSGCGATVGQILECKNETATIPWFKERIIAIGKCLRAHVPDIFIKTAFRAARCVFKAGF